MRSFFKLPGTALLAAAALFAVVATPSAANALTFRAEAVPAAAQSGPESVQSVAINWWDARQARHDVVSALRDDCRTTGSRRNRLQCYREAHRSLRDMQRDAHEAYRDCRGDGGNRRDCRQAAAQDWVDHAHGGPAPTTGADPGAGGGGEVTDDLPQ